MQEILGLFTSSSSNDASYQDLSGKADLKTFRVHVETTQVTQHVL